MQISHLSRAIDTVWYSWFLFNQNQRMFCYMGRLLGLYTERTQKVILEENLMPGKIAHFSTQMRFGPHTCKFY